MDPRKRGTNLHNIIDHPVAKGIKIMVVHAKQDVIGKHACQLNRIADQRLSEVGNQRLIGPHARTLSAGKDDRGEIQL